MKYEANVFLSVDKLCYCQNTRKYEHKNYMNGSSLAVCEGIIKLDIVLYLSRVFQWFPIFFFFFLS